MSVQDSQRNLASALKRLGASVLVDDDGLLHCATGPAVYYNLDAISWYWHGDGFDPENFNELWSDERKAWWMMAMMEGEKTR